MKNYSKAKGMAQWRASLGKQEAKKPRKPQLPFVQLQSYAKREGMAISQPQNQLSPATSPRMTKYQFRLLTLLGILLMFAEKVGGNRRNNVSYQNPPTSQSPIKQYWQDKYQRQGKSPHSMMVPGVTAKYRQVSQPGELSLATMHTTHLPQQSNSGLSIPGSILAEERERPLQAASDFISSIVFQPPLHKVCQENDIEALRQLLSKGVDFTLRNGEGKTVFDLACEQDALAMVRLLLEFGYDPEIPVESDIAPGMPVTNLFVAVHHDNYRLAYTLLKYGRARSFPLLLEMAEKNNNPKMKELLQSYLTKPPRKPTDLIGVSTVAEESTVQFQGRETFNQVNQKIFDISDKVQTEGFYIQPQRRGYGTCIYETYRDEEGQLKSEHWTFSNSESYEFCLAILLESYEDMVRLFPTVDKNYRLPRGYNWMILSSVAADPRLPNFFLHRGLDVNHTTLIGETALHTLAANSKSRSIPNYITAGVNINAQANWGSTPLMIAIDNKNRRQVKELLAGGADLSIRDKQGRDARRRAIEAMWLEELNEILVSLGRTPLLIPMQQRAVSTETADTSKDTEDNAWGLQYGAVLASTVITVFTLAYYTYRKRQEPQPLIQSAPVVRPRKKAVVVASNREIVPAQPVDGRDVEALRKKITFSLEAVKSYFEPEIRETYQQQQFEISIKQTRILNTMARLREKARSRGMRSRYEDLFVRIDKDITLLVDFSDAISEALSEQHQEAYERLMVDMQNPELRYELLEVLCEQVKILSQKIEEEKDFFLEKQACAQKASNRIDRNLDYLELQIAAPEAKNEQAFFKQQQEESQHKAEQEQRALNKKKWQEEKRQRKLSKMEEMKKNKDKEVVSAKKTDKGKQRAMKESRKGEVYLRALGSDVDLLENILDPAKINLYLSDPKLVISCQFYGSCYYVMRIFHRISKMYKFGLGDYAPCSADEAMKMRNAIMHQHESWFSNPGTIISIAGEVMHKLKHTLDALLKAEPAQQMTISIDFPQNVRYSKIKVLDRIYEDYLKVVEEARHLVLNGKYDISQPFHGILKAFNFMLGQILKDFDIQDNPFLAHRDRIGHRFDIVSGEEEDQSLSEEINRWALFELCKPEAMQTLAALVNECQHRAGVNLPPGAQSAASSSSSGHNFPWFFGEQDESGLSIIHGNSSMAPHH